MFLVRLRREIEVKQIRENQTKIIKQKCLKGKGPTGKRNRGKGDDYNQIKIRVRDIGWTVMCNVMRNRDPTVVTPAANTQGVRPGDIVARKRTKAKTRDAECSVHFHFPVPKTATEMYGLDVALWQ